MTILLPFTAQRLRALIAATLPFALGASLLAPLPAAAQQFVPSAQHSSRRTAARPASAQAPHNEIRFESETETPHQEAQSAPPPRTERPSATPAGSPPSTAPPSAAAHSQASSRRTFAPAQHHEPQLPQATPSTSPYQSSRRPASTDKRIGQHPDAQDPIARELAFQRALLHQMSGQYDHALNEARISDEGETGTLYLQGVLLLQQERYQEAAATLARVAQRTDAPDTTHESLGIALINSGQLDRAEALLRTAVQNQPEDQEVRYLLGVTLEYLERRDEADVQFQMAGIDAEQVQTIRQASVRSPAATSEVATSSGIQADRTSLLGPADWGESCCDSCGGSPCGCDSYASGRRWNMTFLTGYEYDSNIPSAPSFVGLGDNIDKDDSRWFAALFADYRIIQREELVVGLLGSAFSNWHFDQDQFDLEDYMGGVYGNMHLYGSTIGGIRYEYHDTHLGGSNLANEHRLTTNMTRFWGDHAHTTFYYEYDTIATNAPALIPAQVQSGDVNSVGATHAIYTMGGDGRIYVGYRFENVDADGDDFVRDSHMVTARLEHPLTDSLMGDVEARYFWDDYKNPNSLDFFGRPRRDERLELRTGLQQTLNDCWSFRVDYTFLTTESSVENLFGVRFFEYDRHILSTQLIYDF